MSNKRALRLILLLAIFAVLLSGCAPVIDENGNPQPPTWIAPIAVPLRLGVTFINDNILAPLGIASYGLAIILLTILLRVLLYPLTRKQMQSMKKMQELQPRLKEIQEKYGKDREKLAQKQMELYKEEGVNPAGGCLPLLLQMPILIGFYYALISLGPLLEEPFLWIPNLAFPEYTQGMGWLSPITPAHLLSPAVLPYLILPIIYIVTQFIMQRMSQAANPATSSGSAGNIMMLMPLMFGYITLIVPSGLSLYWVTSNVIQIIQQGLTTGWSGLNPLKKQQPALAASGASGAVSTTRGQPRSESKEKAKPEPKGGAVPAEADIPGAEATMSAGRRRKLRKKKR